MRQQYNFNPPGTILERENYDVALDVVKSLELTINPDISVDAVASCDGVTPPATQIRPSSSVALTCCTATAASCSGRHAAPGGGAADGLGACGDVPGSCS